MGLKNAWEDHQLCLGMMRDVLMYLVRSRVYIPVLDINLALRTGSTVSIIKNLQYMLLAWDFLEIMFYGTGGTKLGNTSIVSYWTRFRWSAKVIA